MSNGTTIMTKEGQQVKCSACWNTDARPEDLYCSECGRPVLLSGPAWLIDKPDPALCVTVRR